MEKQNQRDGVEAAPSTLGEEEARFKEALNDPIKLDEFLKKYEERQAEAKRRREEEEKKKHPWRHRVREVLGNFRESVSEGLSAMAYGVWVAIREATLPIIAAPTTWRRIHTWSKSLDKYDETPLPVVFINVLVFINVCANIAMIALTIASFANNIAVPAAIIWLITNFLSLSYEIGRAKRKK